MNDESAALLVRTLSAAFIDTFFGDLALRRWAADRAALPAGVTRNEAIDGLLAVWAFGDLAKAREWSGSLAASHANHPNSSNCGDVQINAH